MSKWTGAVILVVIAITPPSGYAQDPAQVLPAPSVSEKWQYFKEETFAPFLIIASAANAASAQLFNGDPRYTGGASALGKRFGAAAADQITGNFFTDFVMASALHEDTRYVRKGEAYGFWSRFGYAVSRGVIARKDTGRRTVNWANITGCAISAGISNAYYPPVSRSLNANIINWADSVAAAGFGNLFPEFLPDFKRFLKRHHL